MNAIAQKDKEQIEFWVDPQHVTGKSAVPIRGRTQEIATVAGEARAFVPTQAS